LANGFTSTSKISTHFQPFIGLNFTNFSLVNQLTMIDNPHTVSYMLYFRKDMGRDEDSNALFLCQLDNQFPNFMNPCWV